MIDTLSLKDRVLAGLSYQKYRELIVDLHDQGKTTGPNQTEQLLEFSKLNEHRMQRLDKQFKITDEQRASLNKINRKVVIMGIVEAWCGDAAQNLPVFATLAEASENLELKLILRDENLDIMDQYLTNGGRSIPKLVFFDAETFEELGQWGPRPQVLQNIVLQNKETQQFTKEALNIELQKWYAKDKGQTTANEVLESLLNSL